MVPEIIRNVPVDRSENAAKRKHSENNEQGSHCHGRVGAPFGFYDHDDVHGDETDDGEGFDHNVILLDF